MKKSIIFLLAFTFITNCVFAQNYSDADIIGTWEGSNIEFQLKSNMTYKMSGNGTSIGGDWKITNMPFSNNDQAISMSYSGGLSDSKFEIVSVSNNYMKLKDASNGSYYSFTKKQPVNNSSISASEAGMVLLGGLLLYSIFGGDSGSSADTPSYQGDYSNDANTNRILRNAHEQGNN